MYEERTKFSARSNFVRANTVYVHGMHFRRCDGKNPTIRFTPVNFCCRKVTRQTVDMWLVTHTTPTSSGSSCMELVSSYPSSGIVGSSSSRAGSTSSGGVVSGGSGSGGNGSCCGGGSGGGSGTNTPVRKISAHEFERGGLLKPIVNTIDGTPTFLSVSPPTGGQFGEISQDRNGNQTVGGTSAPVRRKKRSRNELRQLEKDLIFELVFYYYRTSRSV